MEYNFVMSIYIYIPVHVFTVLLVSKPPRNREGLEVLVVEVEVEGEVVGGGLVGMEGWGDGEVVGGGLVGMEGWGDGAVVGGGLVGMEGWGDGEVVEEEHSEPVHTCRRS